eukprot:scaffold3616_cov97-Skeletonema_dohrnii-CCMP3373.AAC.1
MMFVGYAANRESDSYTYNPDTRDTVTKRAIIWMKRMMYEKKAQDTENSSDEETEDRDSDTDEEEDPPTYITRRRQNKRVRFAYQIEENTEEDNRDDETVEEAAEEDASDTENTDEEATEESTNRDDETVEEATEESTSRDDETVEEAAEEYASDTEETDKEATEESTNRDDKTVEEAAEEENENRDSDTDTEEEDDPPTYLTRRRQTKRVRFAEKLEEISHESNRDDETVEEAAEEDTSETEQNEEEAIKESASDTRARGRASFPPASRSRAGRTLKPTERLIEQMQARAEVSGITAADLQYMQQMMDHLNEDDIQADVMGVGAGVGGGFTNTTELHVLNYKQAMESEDREEWKKEVKNEKNRFDTYNALTPVKRNEVPNGTKIMTSTWAMKRKSNGKLRGRLNLRGFEQRDGEHFVSTSISSPVTNATTVGYLAVIEDVEGAFLQGEFTDGEEIYIEVPQGWEEYYDDDTVLLLNVSIYGTKQEKPNTSIKTLRLLSKGECQTGLFPQQSEWRNDRGIPNTTRLNAPSAARNS